MRAFERAPLSYTAAELSGAALKRAIWNTDWLVGVAFCAVVHSRRLRNARSSTGSRPRSTTASCGSPTGSPPADLAVVAIDDRSIDSIGRWPWTRDILASVIDRLDAGGARIDREHGVHERAGDRCRARQPARARRLLSGLRARARAPAATRRSPPDLATLGSATRPCGRRSRLRRAPRGESGAGGNVVLPMDVVLGRPLGPAPEPMAPWVLASTLALPRTAPRRARGAPRDRADSRARRARARARPPRASRSTPTVACASSRCSCAIRIAQCRRSRSRSSRRRSSFRSRRSSACRTGCGSGTRRSARRPTCACTATTTRIGAASPPSRWIPSTTCSASAFPRTSIAGRSC